MQPVDGTFRHIFCHALDGVVVGPAIVTIKVAFPFRKEIGNDWPQFPAVPARLEIRRAPGLPGSYRAKLLVLALGHFPWVRILRIRRFRGNLGWDFFFRGSWRPRLVEFLERVWCEG